MGSWPSDPGREGEDPRAAAAWSDLRARLTRLGVPDTAVTLPGDDGVPDEGALAVSVVDGGYTLATVDYGTPRVLAVAGSSDSVARVLLDYLGRPLPAPRAIDPVERERLLDEAAPHILDLVARAADPLLIDVPAGILLNRVGALDGYRLYPAETSFEARSLPPTALRSPLHEFLTAAPVRMVVQATPPWFGRTGGGLCFSIDDPSIGIRDLVVSGHLLPVVPARH